jgi:hypothetical protein
MWVVENGQPQAAFTGLFLAPMRILEIKADLAAPLHRPAIRNWGSRHCRTPLAGLAGGQNSFWLRLH